MTFYDFEPGTAIGVSEGEVTDISLDNKYAIESGIFIEHELDLGNNLEFVKTALPAMLSHTKECLVVNMLHARMAPGEPQYFAYNPDSILAILQPLCSEVRLIDDYLPNDFTVIAKPRRKV